MDQNPELPGFVALELQKMIAATKCAELDSAVSLGCLR
jgi:hypothetical protein